MAYVYVTHEKPGTFVYKTALAVVQARLNSGWYSDPSTEKTAKQIVVSRDQDAAWRLLEARGDHEYELVEKLKVIE